MFDFCAHVDVIIINFRKFESENFANIHFYLSQRFVKAILCRLQDVQDIGMVRQEDEAIISNLEAPYVSMTCEHYRRVVGLYI